LERDLITHVIRLKREDCSKILDNILTENIDKRSLGKDRRSAFIFALTATLNRIVESMNKTTEAVFGEGNIVFLELKMCTDGQELKNKVHQLFDRVIDFLDAENRKTEDDLSGQLLDYIHQNYSQDISLLDIGGHFNLSQCYISTLFKDITGENFKDYLSRYRIKRAKEILTEDPSVKNKDLAQQIGCNTVATLFRLFNKYEGISPGQFVKNITRG
jgi:YesN/AraC family two-component response regulator